MSASTPLPELLNLPAPTPGHPLPRYRSGPATCTVTGSTVTVESDTGAARLTTDDIPAVLAALVRLRDEENQRE